MKVTLHQVHCFAKTESDEDEIYCVASTNGGERSSTRTEVGKFDVTSNLRPDVVILDEANAASAMITFLESDRNEPGHGSDDFIGEVRVASNGDCKAGRCTLDEGFDQTRRYRQFSMTGSAAHYAIQLHIET